MRHKIREKTMIERHVPIKHFYMLRHGESVANAERMYSGQIDTPLTKTGILQADIAARVASKLQMPPKIAIHSHLQRAKFTAAPFAHKLGLDMIEIPEWAEQHYGDWQGILHEEVRHLRDAGIDPPNGERNEDFITRISNVLKITLQKYESPLIVCHGGCFRAVSNYFGGTVRGSKNATLYEFVPAENIGGGFPWVVFQYDSENGHRKQVDDFNF